MSFTLKRYEKYARALNLELDQFNELANRMVGYIKSKNEVNTAIIKESFFVYAEILENTKKVQEQKLITANQELKKFGNDIVKLRKIGTGYGTIKLQLNLKVSRSTIRNFCDANNLKCELLHG
jgi:hypothetical protein